MEDKNLRMALLFDFFGDLLTEKQRTYFDLYYNDDLSLSEIAQQTGISRQGVRDNLIRAEHILCEYEEKTGIVERFVNMRSDIESIESDMRRIVDLSDADVREIAQGVIFKVERLKG